MTIKLTKYSIVRISPTQKLMTNSAIQGIFNANQTKSNLEKSFPDYMFKIIPFIENINQLYDGELVLNNKYFVKGFENKLLLTGVEKNKKSNKFKYIFDKKIKVGIEEIF